jgi:dihydrodipicolinate synthase/N-acetylneuraminate lyase
MPHASQTEHAMFKGSLTALITPMHADGRIDEEAYGKLVAWQIAEGTEGLVPVGTTGESPTLTHDEHRRVVEICVGRRRAACRWWPAPAPTAPRRRSS